MRKEEIYINENDMHQSVMNFIADQERFNSMIDSASWKNRDDFKSGMMFGLSIGALEATVASRKVIVVTEDNQYIKVINNLILDEKIRIAENVEDYNEDEYDAVMYSECLCIRGEILDKFMKDNIEGYHRHNLINSLLSIDALKVTSDKCTIKIKNNNKRFYAIKYKALTAERIK